MPVPDQETCQEVFDEAYQYLLEFDPVDEELIEKYLSHWERGEPEDLSDIYRGMLVSGQERQGVGNAIGDIEQLGQFTNGFDPHWTADEYDGWEELFRRIEESDVYTPPGPMEIENSQNLWVQYARTVVSAAEFLQKFDDLEAFSSFVEPFYTTEYTRVSLPLLLSEEIDGFGFALACSFLKENGYPEFIKSDVHIKGMFRALGLSDVGSEFDVFIDVIRFSQRIDELPYRVDKLFWLVGSGRFYLEEDDFRVNTDKDEFIERVNG